MKISFSTTKQQDAGIENNVRLPYAAARRVFPKIRWVLILLIVSSPIIMLLGKIVLAWIFVTSPGTLWLEKKIINTTEAGTVAKIFTQTGDITGPDSVLLRVKRKIPENRLEQIALLEAERDAAAKGLTVEQAAPSGGNSEELQLARQRVAYYEQVRNNTKWLLAQGAATKAEMDLAENSLREAKAAMAAHGAAPSSPAVNPVRAAQVEQSITALKKLTEESYDIKAGQDGIVNSLFVSDGQSFSAGEPLAVIVNTSKVHIVTFVDPKDYKKMNIGTVATVKILGTGRKIKAVVEQSPVAADNVPSGISDKFYPATLRGVQIFLKVLDPLPAEETIEGLPVTVEW